MECTEISRLELDNTVSSTDDGGHVYEVSERSKDYENHFCDILS